MSENTQKKTSSKKETKAEKEVKVEMEVNKTEELEKKIAELETTVAKDKDDYLRLMAEFDNYRRRTSQEKIELVLKKRNGTSFGSCHAWRT